MLTRRKERICWNMALYTLDHAMIVVFMGCSSLGCLRSGWQDFSHCHEPSAHIKSIKWYCKTSPTRSLQHLNFHSNCLVLTCVKGTSLSLSTSWFFHPSNVTNDFPYLHDGIPEQQVDVSLFSLSKPSDFMTRWFNMKDPHSSALGAKSDSSTVSMISKLWGENDWYDSNKTQEIHWDHIVHSHRFAILADPPRTVNSHKKSTKNAKKYQMPTMLITLIKP